jgi:hypothetical protein
LLKVHKPNYEIISHRCSQPIKQDSKCCLKNALRFWLDFELGCQNKIASNEVTTACMVSVLAVHRVRDKFWRLRQIQSKSFSLRAAKGFVDEEKNMLISSRMLKTSIIKREELPLWSVTVFGLWFLLLLITCLLHANNSNNKTAKDLKFITTLSIFYAAFQYKSTTSTDNLFDIKVKSGKGIFSKSLWGKTFKFMGGGTYSLKFY